MSRTKATHTLDADVIKGRLKRQGIELKAASKETVIEESAESYKDVEEVVEACQAVGISRKVVRLRPMGVIKG
jgi:tRNA-splicing ligase RtcB